MSKSRIATDLVIITFYLGIVTLLFYFDSAFILSLFTIPWSIPLMMFSGLILHVTVDGTKFILIGYVIGAVLNSLLFLYLRNRSQPTMV
ncbi:MAG TPA: hypothetical protein PKD24_03435 [Pyrinomonadaceae bacterium]|nr:hypothetical protein [Pyrinomonadaceae bacterium]HMP64603.1 hypothetical protein [Pyrinomonadaceae bacterium]